QLGEMQKALDREQRALDLWRSASHPDGMAYAYTVLGQFSLQLGDPAEARRYQTEALKIWIARQHVSGRAESTFRLGTILEFEGNRQDALERYREALELSASWNDRLGQSKALSRIGGVLASLGRFAEAERTYEEALSTMRQANYDETLVLKGLGDLAAARSQSDQAAGWYSKALDASKRSGDHSPYVETLLAVARLERDRGRFGEAQARLDEATSMIESLRLRITNPEVRASYLASRQMYYELQIDVLMHLAQRTGSAEYRAAAFEVSERARARSLLDWLTVAGVRDNAIDPALVEREEITRQRINGKATALARLKPSDRNGAAGSAFQAEIHALLSEYQQLRSRIAGAAGEPGGEALTTARIQALLDPDTLLLEYALGDERSYLWVVSQKSVATFELPARVSIDRLARRVVELLPLSYKREHAMQATLASNRLSDVILAPAAHLLKGKRLVIVADGALQFVSFPALSDQDGNPLIVGHEIVTLPSASIIAALRRPRLSGRENLELAILADPVFTIDDARLEGRTKGQPIPADLLRSASDFGPDQLQPLPHTRVEADRIAALFPEEHRLRAVGFDASRENILQGQLESYRRIHFATHGLLNAEHPELSGVVLSLYREDGSAQDGFLRLNDIYNLRLQAELVVISACKTALGREVKREGLVGLTRGFMHSGAARVVASLWDVRDVATSELMHRFYRHMILDQLRPAEALRAAQVSMWREPRWRSPFYWGAFQLQGEWR
ncbi:MAG TPA: CHAT domain-containing protein, partial [Thermoanaerobaculia bacterium]